MQLYGGNAQDFTDVPTNYWAYVYIETLFHAGIISGYDQPTCQANNATYPCFLPGYAIQRGQLIKMDSLSAGYNNGPSVPGNRQASYQDVSIYDYNFYYLEWAVMNNMTVQYPPLPAGSPTPTSCIPTTKPCFYNYDDALRADVAAHTFFGTQREHSIPIFNQPGIYGQVGASKSGMFNGLAVNLTPPNWNYLAFRDGEWVAALAAITSRWNDYLVASGPMYFCDPSCNKMVPFASWGLVGQSPPPSPFQYYERYNELDDTIHYQFRSISTGGSTWQEQICQPDGSQSVFRN